ncbi:PIF1-like helicase [Hirsutella rhossiliensis]
MEMMQQLYQFQQSALCSTAEPEAAVGHQVAADDDRRAALRRVMAGFGEDNVEMATADFDETAGDAEAGMHVQFGLSTSCSATGRELATRLTLNKTQSIAFSIICRQLDLMRQNDGGDVGQLCQFVRGEGGTGKSQIIEALVELFSRRSLSNRLLITATSGTAAARINSSTIHSTCRVSKDQGAAANTARDLDEDCKQADRDELRGTGWARKLGVSLLDPSAAACSNATRRQLTFWPQ